MTPRLLSANEPCAYRVATPHGRSKFFIVCDHAGALIPRALCNLGLDDAELARHIAWDIGAAAVAVRLGEILDACVVLQTYSRLVIDCNRPIGAPGSIVALSEATPIPGNQNLSAAEAARREQEVFVPYHERIRSLLDQRLARAAATCLLSLHSFTPVFLGEQRPWHAAVLYNRDPRLARALLAALRGDTNLLVGDNEPYAVGDDSDYAIPEYGEKRGLPHVEIEIRQDLITHPQGQKDWAERLGAALETAAHGLA
jgi:predicted N-formylglutamate amidohydrolase